MSLRTRNYLPKEDPYCDSKTVNQWKAEGRAINADALGELMWHNGLRQGSGYYYTVGDTHPATPEELELWRCERREKARKYRNNARLKAERERLAAERERKMEKKMEKLRQEKLRGLRDVDREQIICLDVETTGLHPGDDEILQLSIIDGNGEVLFDEYVKPKTHTEWKESQEIHGVSPEMVANCQCIDKHVSRLNEIFAGASLIVGYNSDSFDLSFIRAAGVTVPDGIRTFDVMLEFAPIYGEWNERLQDYRWQKLSTCAAYYGYDSNGSFHDSLEDVRATLHCFYAMIAEPQDNKGE